MKDLIRKIRQRWVEAKAEAQAECERQANFDTARKLALCSMFTGDEDLESLVSLMFSPQGAEFLTTYGFPDLATFRKFKKYRPERYGVYIDCGEIAISEPRKAFVVGNTTATIKCAETAGNRVILMHGARAVIAASGYSVVKVDKDQSSDVSIIKQDHAKVLI